MAIDQTKRTGKGTKESPFTKVQIQDLANQGIFEGDDYQGLGRLTPGGFLDKSSTPKQGIRTSDSASKTVDKSRNTLNEIGSNTGASSSGNGIQGQLSQLFEQLSKTRGLLTQAKEKERIAKENLVDLDLQQKLGGLNSSEEGTGDNDLAEGINAINKKGAGGDADSSNIEDPVLKGITDATMNRVASIQSQVTRLDDYRKLMSDFSQGEVDDIQATALRSVKRQVSENDRVRRSLEFAGMVGGRALSAPRVEDTIIHEIIQDGLDRIDVIEDKKNTAIRQARQAEVEFDYALFTDRVSLAKEYNKEIEDGITSLKAEVRQAEKDEQSKITFNQQQQDRGAILLAPEIYEETKNMSPEAQQAYLSQVSAANDIPLGSLLREVRDYTPDPVKVSGGTKAGSGAVIGDFSQIQSDKLRAAGLQDMSIEDQRQYLFGNSEARQIVLDKAGVVEEPTTMDDVISKIKDEMNVVGTLGKGNDDIDSKLHAQAKAFGTASGWTGARSDVKRLIKHPAVEPAVQAEIDSGTSAEDILKLLANDAIMSQLLSEHKAK